MHKAPLDERFDFYRYRSGGQFLEEARLVLLETRRLNRDSPIIMHKALWVSFHTIYGKPFKQQRDKFLKRGLRLPDDIVPSKYLRDHQEILEFRDKMFAHTDFADFSDNSAMQLNALLITQVDKYQYCFTNRFFTPALETVDRYFQLLDVMIEKAHYRAQKIWKRWAKHTYLPIGTTWKVNIGTATDAVLLRDELS